MMETTAAITANNSRAAQFESLVSRAYQGKITMIDHEATLESSITLQFSKMGTLNHKRDTFRDLLLMMYAKKCYAVLRNPSYVEVLANMSVFGNKTIRRINSWTKDSLTAEGQLKSLIRHCFAKYDVPAFMENVFAGESKVQMLWYIQLGRGDSVQQLCAFPVKFTAKMAHEFRNMPAGCTVARAIRKAQALGFGSDMARADAIAWSSLSDGFEDETFNSAVVQFIVNVKEEVAFNVLQSVLEYLQAMRKENKAFSMRGRTWTALVRQSADWQIAMALKRDAEGRSQWAAAPIANYTVADGESTFRIIQLTTSEALYEEGDEMAHCVAEYDDACEEGRTAIFSLRKFIRGQAWHETLATVEVFLEDMEIVQAKARFNNMICDTAHALICEWAQREKLAVSYEFLTAEELERVRIANQAVQPAPACHGVAPGGRQEQHLNNYAEALQQRQQEPIYRPYRPYNAYESSSGFDTKTVVKFVLIGIKIMILMAKCSQG